MIILWKQILEQEKLSANFCKSTKSWKAVKGLVFLHNDLFMSAYHDIVRCPTT